MDADDEPRSNQLDSRAEILEPLVRPPVAALLIAMGMEEAAETPQDERLLFSLIYQQVECVIQLAYRTTRRDNWIDVEVKVDNVRSVVLTCKNQLFLLHELDSSLYSILVVSCKVYPHKLASS